MTRRLVLALCALAVLIITCAGVPTFLVLLVGNPWPGRDAVDLGDTEALFVAVLATMTWAVWARFVVAVLIEATEQIACIRRRVTTAPAASEGAESPPPVSRSVAGLAAHWMVAAAFMLFPAPRALPVASAPPPLVQVVPVGADAGALDTMVAPPLDRPDIAPDTASRHVVVRRGDSLVELAERHLGDGSRWREIFDLNRGIAQRDGMHLTTPSSVRAGWTMKLPAADPVHHRSSPLTGAEGALPDTGARTYTVRIGDGPWDVAEALVGDGTRFQDVLDANVGLEVAPGVIWTHGQRVIHPGWSFRWDVTDQPAHDLRRSGHEVEIVVEAGDTLTAIIDANVEAPVTPALVRWVAARNDGASTPDGTHVFDASNPDLIHPGQRLLVADPNTDSRSGEPREKRADSGDERPPREEDDAPRNGRRRPPPPAVPTPPPPTVAPRTPSTSDAPTVPATTPHTPPSSPPTSPVTTVPIVASRAGTQGTARPSPPSPIPIGIGAVALSSGLVAMLEVSRRKRLRSARARERLAAPTSSQIDVERELRSISAPERLLRVDVAIRAAAPAILLTPHRIAVVLADHSGDVTVVTTGAVDLPPPWESTNATATRWRLPASIDVVALAGAARGLSAPCAALTPVGVTTAGSDVFLDLEAAGTMYIATDERAGLPVLTAIAAGLASSMFAEGVHLIGVGLPDETFLQHPNQHSVDSIEAAIRLTDELVGTTPRPTDTTFALRARHTSGENWEPAVVFLAAGLERAATAWRPRAGVVLVTVGEPSPGTWTLRPADACWVLEPPAIELTPTGIAPAELLALNELIAPVAKPTGRNGRNSVAVDVHRSPVFGCGVEDVGTEPEWAVMIRVFGLVDVVDRVGRVASFTKSKALELLAWLGTHREHATRLGARAALWELDVRDATFANVVSEARRGLGRLVPPPPDQDWVGRSSASLPLHERVITDVDLIEIRLAQVAHQSDVCAVSSLRSAVALIRGVPFSESGYLWPDAEGTTSRLVMLATTCVTELAERELAAGNLDGVFDATGTGLRVLPGHEESIGLRMRAHAARGDRAGIRHEWQTYERVVVSDPWSDGEPSPTLVRLRQELLDGCAR